MEGPCCQNDGQCTENGTCKCCPSYMGKYCEIGKSLIYCRMCNSEIDFHLLKWSLLIILRFLEIGCSNYCFNEGTHSTCTIDENCNPKCNCWGYLDWARYIGNRCEIESTKISFSHIRIDLRLLPNILGVT